CPRGYDSGQGGGGPIVAGAISAGNGEADAEPDGSGSVADGDVEDNSMPILRGWRSGRGRVDVQARDAHPTEAPGSGAGRHPPRIPAENLERSLGKGMAARDQLHL